MIKNELPIPIHRLAFLQAYLYEIFTTEKQCENNFKYTEWYFGENYSDKELKLILVFLKELGVKCDCDVIKNIDLRELTNKTIKFHK